MIVIITTSGNTTTCAICASNSANLQTNQLVDCKFQEIIFRKLEKLLQQKVFHHALPKTEHFMNESPHPRAD